MSGLSSLEGCLHTESGTEAQRHSLIEQTYLPSHFGPIPYVAFALSAVICSLPYLDSVSSSGHFLSLNTEFSVIASIYKWNSQGP